MLDKSTPPLLVFLGQKPPFVIQSNHGSLRLNIKTSPFQPFLSTLTEVLLQGWKSYQQVFNIGMEVFGHL